MTSFAPRYFPARRSIRKGGSLVLAVLLFASASIANAAPGGGKGKPPPKTTPTPAPTATPAPTPVDGRTDWNGTTSSDFNTGTNWTPVGVPPGGAPPVAGDVAWFKAAPSNKAVNLSSSVSISGLYFNGTGASGYSLTNSGGAVFTLTGHATSIGTEISDATAVAIGAENTSGTNTISAPIILAPASGTNSTIFQAGGGTLGINGNISGSANLIKTGTGTLVLSGNNTYSGTTTISGGTLQLGNGGSGGSLSTSSAIINNGNFTINQNDGVVQGVDFSGSGITGTGSFTQAGSATTTLNAVNSYSGGTFITSSTLYMTGVGTLGATTGALQLDFFGSLDLNGTSQTVGALNGSGGMITSTSFSPSSLTIGNGGANGTYTGAISNAPIVGAISLTKIGAGTQTLYGTNTYTGTTMVDGGKLLVNGSLGSGSAVTVSNSGTVLGGFGTINGPVTVNGTAKLQGGDGTVATTLTLSSALTLNDNSIIQLALGSSASHSTLARTGSGTWTFDINQAFTFIDLGATTTTYNNIITGLAGDPGNEALWTITNPGWIGTFTYDGSGNIDLTLNFIVTPIPEPSTWIGGSLALAALAFSQRRRVSRVFKRA